MPNVSLTPELESFAERCVATGRYGNVSEVMRAALRLLQDQEEKRAAFTRMLEAAEREADETGWFEVEQVADEMDAIIAEAEAKRGQEQPR
jgi:antitoxin ParD1/3/4